MMIEMKITGSTGTVQMSHSAAEPLTIGQAAFLLDASPSDMPGLWNVAGYPELTTFQLLALAEQRMPSQASQ